MLYKVNAMEERDHIYAVSVKLCDELESYLLSVLLRLVTLSLSCTGNVRCCCSFVCLLLSNKAYLLLHNNAQNRTNTLQTGKIKLLTLSLTAFCVSLLLLLSLRTAHVLLLETTGTTC
jgi:hypothetical protein